MIRSTERQTLAMTEQNELSARIAENERLAASLNEEIGNIKSKGKSLTERSLELERQATVIRQSSRDKTGDRERLVRNSTNLESILERINAEQDTLTERLADLERCVRLVE